MNSLFIVKLEFFGRIVISEVYNRADINGKWRNGMIQIQYVEYNAEHDEDFVFNVPEGHKAWLVLLTKTPAIFLVEGKMKKYPPNCAVIFKPGQKIFYQACDGGYANDWIRFVTDESYIPVLPLPFGEPFIVHDPSFCHMLFQLLVTEHVFDNEYKCITIDNLMRILFNKLLESYNYKSISPLINGLNELKMNIYTNPEMNWTVTNMAKQLNVSKGYLELIYKETFGVTCIDDVINSRITLAKKYLLYDQYSITEIARKCGYKNVEHFYRQFKKYTGKTPSNYKKSMHQIKE